MSIEAVIEVSIDLRAGEELADVHVLRWLVADGAWFEGTNGVQFEVCPDHDDPDECDGDCDAEVSTYFANFHSAGLAD
jgi:hypothetical protein